MPIDLIRLLFDFGLLVLIWMVQLVVYPSFLYYSRENLLKWHQKYMLQVTCIVLPLMTGQLIAVGIQIWAALNWYTGSSLLIVGLLWASTFLQFVPLHSRISLEDFNEETLAKLVKRNWLRTALWTGLFALSLAYLMPALPALS